MVREIVGKEVQSGRLVDKCGAFGIYCAVMVENDKPADIGIKLVPQAANKDAKLALIREIELTKGLVHRNILAPLAVKTENEPIFMVHEPCPAGFLHTYLKNHLVPVDALRDGALQIASALQYLQASNIVHWDVATRNVLLTDTFSTKLTNFGLGKSPSDESPHGYYKAKYGLEMRRWPAPEIGVLEGSERQYRLSEDIWGFGIFLYELFTKASLPYGDVWSDSASYLETMYEAQEGHILPQPPRCPNNIYKIMVSCWEVDPAERMNFKRIIEMLLSTQDKEPYVDVSHKAGFGVHNDKLSEKQRARDEAEQRMVMQLVELRRQNPVLAEAMERQKMSKPTANTQPDIRLGAAPMTRNSSSSSLNLREDSASTASGYSTASSYVSRHTRHATPGRTVGFGDPQPMRRHYTPPVSTAAALRSIDEDERLVLEEREAQLQREKAERELQRLQAEKRRREEENARWQEEQERLRRDRERERQRLAEEEARQADELQRLQERQVTLQRQAERRRRLREEEARKAEELRLLREKEEQMRLEEEAELLRLEQEEAHMWRAREERRLESERLRAEEDRLWQEEQERFRRAADERRDRLTSVRRASQEAYLTSASMSRNSSLSALVPPAPPSPTSPDRDRLLRRDLSDMEARIREQREELAMHEAELRRQQEQAQFAEDARRRMMMQPASSSSLVSTDSSARPRRSSRPGYDRVAPIASPSEPASQSASQPASQSASKRASMVDAMNPVYDEVGFAAPRPPPPPPGPRTAAAAASHAQPPPAPPPTAAARARQGYRPATQLPEQAPPSRESVELRHVDVQREQAQEEDTSGIRPANLWKQREQRMMQEQEAARQRHEEASLQRAQRRGLAARPALSPASPVAPRFTLPARPSPAHVLPAAPRYIPPPPKAAPAPGAPASPPAPPPAAPFSVASRSRLKPVPPPAPTAPIPTAAPPPGFPFKLRNPKRPVPTLPSDAALPSGACSFLGNCECPDCK